MNTDFRLSIGLFTHPKFIKLQRKLGDAGGLSYIRLLSFTAQHRPTGNLTGMDAEDIAIAAQWDSDAETFVAALVQIGLLDDTGEGYYAVHDWVEHNPWAAGAPERSEKGKKAADARWGNSGSNRDECKTHANSNAGSMQDASGEHARSNTPLLPSPSLSVSKNPRKAPREGIGAVAEDYGGVGVEENAEKSEVQGKAEPASLPPARRPAVKRASQHGWSWLTVHPDEANAQHADRFESFWDAYPRRESPRDAWKAWQKLLAEWTDDLERRIDESLAAHCRSAQWAEDKSKIPHPATWINSRRWEGEPPPMPAANGPNGAKPPPGKKAEPGVPYAYSNPL